MSNIIARSYLSDCRLLRALAKVLELPAVATTTAFMYLHKIKLGEHPCHLSGQDLVSACIYVAAKAEEVNVSTNYLLNTARLLNEPTQQHILHVLAPFDGAAYTQQHSNATTAAAPAAAVSSKGTAQAAPEDMGLSAAGARQQKQQQDLKHGMPPPGHRRQQPEESGTSQQQQQQSQQDQQQLEALVVTGDAYYAAKDRLFTAEQIVLRLLRFQLGVPQPHKYLLNFCRLLEVSRSIAAAAVCLLNDAIAYTGLCTQYEAGIVAAAALQLAAVQLALPQSVTEQHISASAMQSSKASDSSRLAKGGKGRHSDEHHQYSTDKFTTRHHAASASYEARDEANQRATVGGNQVSAGVAALRDGGWLHVVGLQEKAVAEVVGVLRELLQLKQ